MVTEKEIHEAMKRLHRRLGTQQALADRGGITQSTVSAYLRGKAKIVNMPVGVFLRLFREMTIRFGVEEEEERESGMTAALRLRLLELFDSLPDGEKVRMVTENAAEFGSKHRGKTKLPATEQSVPDGEK